MNTQQFLNAYNESRNGANRFYRHPLVRTFIYSDGVQEVAEAGCYWMLDIIGTECLSLVRDEGRQGIVNVEVQDGKASMRLSFDDDSTAWRKKVDYTDMPDGDWAFVLGWDGQKMSMILLSEY